MAFRPNQTRLYSARALPDDAQVDFVLWQEGRDYEVLSDLERFESEPTIVFRRPRRRPMVRQSWGERLDCAIRSMLPRAS